MKEREIPVIEDKKKLGREAGRGDERKPLIRKEREIPGIEDKKKPLITIERKIPAREDPR